MFEKIGWLKEYWHVIWLSQELKKWKQFKRKVYWIPFLLWRDSQWTLHAFLDVCPHKRAPLDVVDYSDNFVQCSYHGWRFWKEWDILEIPSSPHLLWKIKCKWKKYQIAEQDGFIWIYLDNTKKAAGFPQLFDLLDMNWRYFHSAKDFETTDELLIENFMDATHTPVIHNGLIRDKTTKTLHNIIIEDKKESVLVKFWENNENVWLGINKLFIKKLKISHTDEFLLPNIVKVNYKINGVERFQAIIACTPLKSGKTRAFLKISFNFWIFSSISKIILPLFAKKVLQQDFDITSQQFKNRELFQNMLDNDIDYDTIHNSVIRLRKDIIERKEGNRKSRTQKVTIEV